MQLHTHLIKSVFGKAALAAAALGGFLFFSGAPSAQARDRDDYRRPIIRHEVIVERGYYSPRAEYWRHERREAFEHGWRDRYGCWHRY
jgi:hypothetical protein